MLDIVTVGLAPDLVPYLTGWDLQRNLHQSVVAGDRPDTVLLLEHTAVFTAGTRTTPDERPVEGTPVIDVDRGGKITWHGPGQLVGYPIVTLPEPIDVVAHVRRLETLLIDALATVGVTGERVRGRTGVWVNEASDENPRYSKIAAIGVRVSEGVSSHGFALNCSNSLEPFTHIVPCGIRDAGVTTISKVLGHTVTPHDMIARVSSALRNSLDLVTA